MATQFVEQETVERIVQPKLEPAQIRSKIHGRIITTKVVGVSFENRQEVIARLQMGDRVWLEREPSNPFDFNAIKVSRSNGDQIGFLDRFLAANVTRWFDAYQKPVRGKVHLLTGSARDGYTLGVVIVFKLPKLQADHRKHCRKFNDWDE